LILEGCRRLVGDEVADLFGDVPPGLRGDLRNLWIEDAF